MACPAPFAKIFPFAPDPNQFHVSHCPAPKEGRCATSSTRGGMRWTRAVRETSAVCWRTAKSCRSDAPWLASSLREDAQATVSNKPGHRGEHEVSRKTIARGMPGRSGVTVVTMLVCFFILHARPRRIARPAFPAPSLSRAHSVINSGAIRAARTWNSGRLAGRNISSLAKAAPTGQKNPEKEKTPAERHIEHQGQGLHRRDLRASNPACTRQINRAVACRSRQGRD